MNIRILNSKRIDRAALIFDEEFKNGYTPQEAKGKSIKRVSGWSGGNVKEITAVHLIVKTKNPHKHSFMRIL